jgi:hypothetical protein
LVCSPQSFFELPQKISEIRSHDRGGEDVRGNQMLIVEGELSAVLIVMLSIISFPVLLFFSLLIPFNLAFPVTMSNF